MKFIRLVLPIFLACIRIASAQVQTDTTYTFDLQRFAYQSGQGPVILIDAAHHNYHTADNRFRPFAKLLEADGYRILSNTKPIHSSAALSESEILVIANPIHPSNLGNWSNPIQQAFERDEIGIISKWVEQGGSLLLIADHMPFGGAVQSLAEAFGFEFYNGFAPSSAGNMGSQLFFTDGGGLTPNEVTKGIHPQDKVKRITTFTGTAFKAPAKAQAVLTFDYEGQLLLPDTAWQFGPGTKSLPLKGLHQGAILNYGKGKIAVFGEAAMFSAQETPYFKAGMNSPLAPENAQFVLNVIHWLDGLKKYDREITADENEDDHPVFDQLEGMVDAFRKQDLEAVADYYADEAVMIGQRMKTQGEAVKKYWMNLKGRALDWDLETISTEVCGDYVIQEGISRMKFLANGKPVISDARYTLIWKQIEGEWKIVRDHYSAL